MPVGISMVSKLVHLAKAYDLIDAQSRLIFIFLISKSSSFHGVVSCEKSVISPEPDITRKLFLKVKVKEKLNVLSRK